MEILQICPEAKRQPTVLDLFSGAGGFSLGFQLAGFEIVGGIEKDEWAVETFAYNHPDAVALRREIDLMSDKEVVDSFSAHQPDVIVGGPPCQGFSVCTRGAGDPTDPRNSLFTEFVRVCKLLSPQLFVMENVPNLLKATTSSGSKVITLVEEELTKLGYYVYSKVLEATDFGVPQIRKRLFVIGSKVPLQRPFPAATHSLDDGQESMFSALASTPTLWDAISDLPLLKAGEGRGEMQYDRAPENSYQRELRGSSRFVYNHTAMKHSKRMVDRFASMKCGDSVTDVPEHLKPFARNFSGVTSTKVYDQNNRRMHSDRPCHTIPAAFYANFVHPFAHRNFTPREGARLQSFPDWYRFCGKPTVVSHKLLAREGRFAEKHLCQYNQIGNAVPPLLARAVASNLKNQVWMEKLGDAGSREQPVAKRTA